MLMKHPFKNSVLVYLDEGQVKKCKGLISKVEKYNHLGEKRYLYLKEALNVFMGKSIFPGYNYVIDFDIFEEGDDFAIIEIKSFSLDGIKIINPIEFSCYIEPDYSKASIFI